MRLIDADALPKYTGYALSANEVAMAVENAPTIDATPVVHGKWVDDLDIPKEERERHPYLYLHGERYCSACYEEAYYGTDYGYEFFDYCPNCGAKMDGGEDE